MLLPYWFNVNFVNFVVIMLVSVSSDCVVNQVKLQCQGKQKLLWHSNHQIFVTMSYTWQPAL